MKRGCVENAEVFYYLNYIQMHFFYADNYPGCIYNVKKKMLVKLIISNMTEVYILEVKSDKVTLQPR
jgi:hypothetical protein